MANSEIPNVQVIIVGDGGCGKTALLLSFLQNKFHADYVPTVLDQHEGKEMVVNDKKVHLRVWDTSGQESYEDIRKMSYVGSNIFLICYDVLMRSSFDNIEQHWLVELRKEVEHPQIIICGNKLDLVKSNTIDFVSEVEASDKATKIGAFASVQCSARDYVKDAKLGRVKDVFQKVAECGLEKLPKERKERKCVLL